MAESKFCTGCLRDDENNIGEAWCCDCAELVCKTCSKCHKKLSPPHKIILVENVSRLSSSILKLSRQCEFHDGEKTVLFCCQHDQLICGACVSESHQNCKPVITIEMAATGVQRGTAVTDLEKRIDNLTRIMENILSIYNTELSNLGEQKKNIMKEVADIKAKIVSHLDKLERDFNEELYSKFNKCREQITKNNSDIQCKYDTLTAWKENMESLKNYTSNVQVFHAIKYLDAKTHREETEFRKFKTGLSISKLTFKPSEQISTIHDILSSLGTLLLDTSNITSPSDLDIDQQGQVCVRSEVQIRQLKLVTSFETTRLGESNRTHKGCFVPDNKLLLGNYFKEKVYLCDHNGSNAKTVNLDLYYYPCDVTLYDKNTALVSAREKGIQIIDLNTLKPGKRIKVGSKCEGITSLNGKIWVKSDTRTLTMIDINGNVQKKFSTCFDPDGISLTKDGDIYCTDNNSDDVYVVTSGGEQRVVYSSPDLRYPYGISVDDRGNVYISGARSANIHRISSDGQQSNIILTKEDGIYSPTGLSFNHQTKELMVHVVRNTCSCINIYKMS